ncbi:MAG: hypothetical protein QW212_00525 [Nitrososphaerales archaeon]
MDILVGYRTPSEIPARSQSGCVIALIKSDFKIANTSINEEAQVQVAYYEATTYDSIDEFKQRAEELFFYITLSSEYVLKSIEYAYNDMFLFALATFSVFRKV